MSLPDPYTDETVQGHVDPDMTMFPRLRSEEATGGLDNTAAEVAQHLRRLDKDRAQKTAHTETVRQQRPC
jgi:hypothetical protein